MNVVLISGRCLSNKHSFKITHILHFSIGTFYSISGNSRGEQPIDLITHATRRPIELL